MKKPTIEQLLHQTLSKKSEKKQRKPKSFFRILLNKFLIYFEDEDLRKIFRGISKFAGFSIVCFAFYSPDKFAEFFARFYEFRNFFFPKILLAGLIFYFLEDVFHGILFSLRKIALYFLTRSYLKELRNECSTEEENPSESKIFGIPVQELVDHLFESGAFKRTETEEKFLIPRRKYSELAKKLEEAGILIRGDNNSRVLNPEISRENVSNILRGAEDVEEINPLLRDQSPDNVFSLQRIA